MITINGGNITVLVGINSSEINGINVYKSAAGIGGGFANDQEQGSETEVTNEWAFH